MWGMDEGTEIVWTMRDFVVAKGPLEDHHSAFDTGAEAEAFVKGMQWAAYKLDLDGQFMDLKVMRKDE